MEFTISNRGEKILTIKNKNITELTNTEDVEILCCRGCTSLTSIPNIEGLKKLRCDGCTSITSIPNIKGLKYNPEQVSKIPQCLEGIITSIRKNSNKKTNNLITKVFKIYFNLRK